MKQETKTKIVFIIILMVLLGVVVTVAYTKIIRPIMFCKSKGYDYIHTDTTEYIECCKNVGYPSFNPTCEVFEES